MGDIWGFASLTFCSRSGVEESPSGSLTGKPQRWEGPRCALHTVRADQKSVRVMGRPARTPRKVKAKRHWRVGCNSVFLSQPTHRPVPRALQTHSVGAGLSPSRGLVTKPADSGMAPKDSRWKKEMQEIKNWAKTPVASHSEGNRFHSLSLRKIRHNQESLSLIRYVWVPTKSH